MEGQNMSATTEKWTIFGERLKAELERQGMSLRQFSGKTGITLNTAFRYVHSQRVPRATEILKAAKVLGVTCDYMLGLSDDPHKTRDGWSKARNLQPTCNLASDCISRQAAIDAILAVTGNSSVRELYEHVQEHGLSDMWSGGVNAAIDIIIAVPSAQSEKRTDKCTETHACDLIDRQAAIDAVMEFMPSLTTPDGCGQYDREIFEAQEMFVDIGQALNDLPSAQQRWIPFKCRKPTEEEGTAFDYIMDCKCPEDGQNILVSINIQGHEPVQYDTFYGGGGEECCLESGYELVEEATAWMPLPEPYAERRTDE